MSDLMTATRECRPGCLSVGRRPSSPRQFFQRLYGHLEHAAGDLPSQSSPLLLPPNPPPPSLPLSSPSIQVSDVSSPSPEPVDQHSSTIFNIGTEVGSHHAAAYTLPVSNAISAMTLFPQGFASFRPLLAINDDSSSPGLSAFLARRRRKGRPRRQRTTFSSVQTDLLELEFHRHEYISRGRRFELAEMLRLSEMQIKIWFQNRRAKDKRIEKAQIDQQYRHLVATNTYMTPFNYSHLLTNTAAAAAAAMSGGVSGFTLSLFDSFKAACDQPTSGSGFDRHHIVTASNKSFTHT